MAGRLSAIEKAGKTEKHENSEGYKPLRVSEKLVSECKGKLLQSGAGGFCIIGGQGMTPVKSQ